MLPAVTPTNEIAMGSIMPTLGVVVVVLRLCSKHRNRQFRIDDYLIIISVVWTISNGG